MATYDPLLSGDVNLYNVTLAAAAITGLGAVATLIGRASGGRASRPDGVSRRAVAIRTTPVMLGAVVFVLFVFAKPQEDLPSWGVFYLLPAGFLAAVSVLAFQRPAQAGAVLAIAAIVAFILLVALGIVAGRIDPQWTEDEIDRGSLAAMTLFFSLPAMLTALGLLTLVHPAHRIDPIAPSEPAGRVDPQAR